MSEAMKSPVYKEFVSATLCNELMQAGLEVQLPFFWKVYQKAILKSFAFDNDDYYKEGDIVIDQLYPPTAIIPAFQIGDLDKLMPDYYISRVNNEFTLSILDIYRMGSVTEKRLPDAYAKMILACIHHHIIWPAKAIHILTEKNPA